MSEQKQYYVYIMASRSRVLYTGVTSNIGARVEQHKRGATSKSFPSRYDTTILVYVEQTDDVRAAITREKQIKGWLRARKIVLIESMNPSWSDLSAGWFADR